MNLGFVLVEILSNPNGLYILTETDCSLDIPV